LLLVAILLVAGCSGRAMDERAVSYNLQVERATNNLLLLNIIRASLRHPLHFTTFTDVHSPGSSGGGSGVSVPLGVSGQSGFLFTPNLSLTENVAQFGIGVLGSSEFTRGIATPVTVATVDLFLRRSLHIEHQLGLFTSRIETAGGDVFVNIADDRRQLAFQKLPRLLVALGLITETIQDVIDIGPPIAADQVNAIQHARDLVGSGVSLMRTGRGYQLRRMSSTQRFCFARPPMLQRRGDVPDDDAFILRALRVTCRDWLLGHLGESSWEVAQPVSLQLRHARLWRELPHEQRLTSGNNRLVAFAETYFPGIELGLWPSSER
jgi:hypothetical protein